MNTNLKISILLKEVMPEAICNGYWELEYALRFIMNNSKSINNLSRNVYPTIADKFGCKPWCIEKNISRLKPFIDTDKLSAIAGYNIKVDDLSAAKLIKILVVCLTRKN